MKTMFARLRELIFGRNCANAPHGCLGKASYGGDEYCGFCWNRALTNSTRYKAWTADSFIDDNGVVNPGTARDRQQRVDP